MNFPIPPPSLDPLYVFLPLVLAGLVTVLLLSAQSIAQFFADRDEGSK